MQLTNLSYYIDNPEDSDANFNLALEYDSLGQTGAALSFYLRAAERATDDLKQYEALLKCARCFDRQGLRDMTEEAILQKAIVLIHNRPEAYFLLSRLYEKKKDWQNSYTFAVLGLTVCDFNLSPLQSDVLYPGWYGLYFQKGVSAWWVGKNEEAREIMADLKYNYKMSDQFTNIVDSNLNSIGYPQLQVKKNSLDFIKPISNTSEPRFINKISTTINTSSRINNDPRPGFWVVDNFYKDPDSIRKFALEQEYHQGGIGRGYIGRRTFKQFLFPELKPEFERIMGREITAWEEHGMNGRFQYNTEGEPLVYHCDSQKWAAMIYLTPDAPFETGTGTHAIKKNRVFHNSQEGIMEAFRPGSQNLDKTILEPVDVIGNVYNRLVIFNAGYLHSALGYFGYNQDNCRLWQMFFFD